MGLLGLLTPGFRKRDHDSGAEAAKDEFRRRAPLVSGL
jgi:hypothetical protein